MNKPKLPFSHNDYEIINREVMYQGIFRLARYRLRHQLFSGGWSAVLIREVLERLSAIAILPYDPVSDRVVLIEQFRPGALAHPQSPWVTEIVAGVIDTKETPEEIAIREAKEEAACIIEDLIPIYDLFVTPGASTEYLYLFCGKVNASSIGGLHGLAKENEDIRAFTLDADEAFEQMRSGLIKTVPAIIALQWLQIHRDFVREQWLHQN
jgi:ADP-ribose pyrophosphatase